MAFEFSGIKETPEELEIRRRQSTMHRIRILSVVCVVAIGARLLIKDPKPLKAPDRSKKAIKYTPGMIEEIPLSTLNKMDPKMVAEMRAAEARYREEMDYKANPFYARGKYKAAEIPLTNNADLEALKQAEFLYAKKQVNRLLQEKARQSQDLSKPTLIRFRSGGFIKAENATPRPKIVQIQLGRNTLATLPEKMVFSIMHNALKWEEPLPRGYVQLKPARGITITVASEAAKRITIRKKFFDET